ncbi:AAA-domain-containing protein [Daldinia vernicosa]|uniref:AAA-domain-containing protein n=1 Tax=Daldinia vernicosa TaxID=114800 RepID=UPI0020074576|nr:AAA-domain-containing protein [Daldinia vernicosa]KAI0852311.1 AAA-domain-containing protein [Daldinia vernicosa]
MAGEDITEKNAPTAQDEPKMNDKNPEGIEDADSESAATSSNSTNGIMTPATTEDEVSQPELPSWFKSCIKTFEELAECDIPLTINDASNNQAPETEKPDHYVIDSVMYESLFDIVFPRGTKEQQDDSDMEPPRKFCHDAMALRMPHESHGQQFLNLVVQRFARDIGADIITLGLHDFENLATHFATLSGHSLPEGMSTFRDLYFEEPEKPSETPKSDEKPGTSSSDPEKPKSTDTEPEKPEKPEPEKEARKKLPFPFAQLFTSTLDKRGSQVGTPENKERPIIILLPEVADDFYKSPRNVLTHLRDAVKEAKDQGKEIAVIAIDNQEDRIYGCYYWGPSPSDDDGFLSDLGFNPVKAVQIIVPVKTDLQKKLLEQDHKKTTQKVNIRKLQRKVQEGQKVPSFSGSLEPHVDWRLSEESFATKRLNDPNFNDREIELTASALGTNSDIENVERVFARLKVLHEWMEEEEKTPPPGQWDSLHEDARKAIETIKGDSCKYKHENSLLDSIVSSDTVEQSWKDIEVDEDTKSTIKQLVDLASSDPKSQYGLLSKSRIRGALLYGPPGTGKTQLARVLAHEYKAVMIHVSAAELESKWVGESEKQIKALFNLGSMVAPSIIFIDEADALFRKRGPDDRSWERSRLNELLNQQDGLKASKMPPFLLLATNHPNDLDDAVMRRVPARLFIGLPSRSAREKIFSIFLRDEKVDPSVNLSQLAGRTAGFTGSDIKTICTQAALICQDELDKAEKSSETRVLTKGHFDAALARTGPTVSDGAVRQIRDFAKKFDPSAVQKMDRAASRAQEFPLPSPWRNIADPGLTALDGIWRGV